MRSGIPERVVGGDRCDLRLNFTCGGSIPAAVNETIYTRLISAVLFLTVCAAVYHG
jgi:hypothetical protein